MIPQSSLIQTEFEVEVQPSKTFKYVQQANKYIGKVDEREALIQAIYLILNIDRYAYVIYSWNYGIEISDLIGKPMSYVKSEVKRRIPEALERDDRINSVDTFEFEEKRHVLIVTCVAHTIFGDIEVEKEVSV